MAHAKHMMIREIGMALAVLSIWLMSLLAPVHQVAQLFGALSQAGITVETGWSLCQSLDPDDAGEGGALPLCPAQGLGKANPPEPLARAVLLLFIPTVVLRGFDLTPERFWSRFHFEPGQPRAPPLHS